MTKSYTGEEGSEKERFVHDYIAVGYPDYWILIVYTWWSECGGRLTRLCVRNLKLVH